MQFHRNEISTGILVIGTSALLFLVIMYLGAPGMLKSFKTFYVLLPNAMGMKSGDPVYLAGRRIGQVTLIESPTAKKSRPVGFENYEVRAQVSVEKNTLIYNKVTVSLKQLGLLGDPSLDFQNGDEASGLAFSGKTLIGQKEMDFQEVASAMLEMIQPVAREVTSTLVETKKMLTSFNRLMGDKGSLHQAAGNIKDFSDTIKRQPWRLVWKATKKYPEETTEVNKAK